MRALLALHQAPNKASRRIIASSLPSVGLFRCRILVAFLVAAGALALTVPAHATTITLSAPSTVAQGSVVTLTATVTSNGSTAISPAIVYFYDTASSPTLLGAADVNSSGVATINDQYRCTLAPKINQLKGSMTSASSNLANRPLHPGKASLSDKSILDLLPSIGDDQL